MLEEHPDGLEAYGKGQMTKGRVVAGFSEVVGLSMSELLLSSQGDADVTGNC